MADSSIVGATFTVAPQGGFNLGIVYYLQKGGFANMGRGKPCPYEVVGNYGKNFILIPT
jgi:hypothetical protein